MIASRCSRGSHLPRLRRDAAGSADDDGDDDDDDDDHDDGGDDDDDDNDDDDGDDDDDDDDDDDEGSAIVSRCSASVLCSPGLFFSCRACRVSSQARRIAPASGCSVAAHRRREPASNVATSCACFPLQCACFPLQCACFPL